MPQHANRGVLKHAARGYGSGGGGQKVGERGSKTRFDVTAYHERSIAPIAEAFHFSRVPRLSVSDWHAMSVAAAWDVSVPLRAC